MSEINYKQPAQDEREKCSALENSNSCCSDCILSTREVYVHSDAHTILQNNKELTFCSIIAGCVHTGSISWCHHKIIRGSDEADKYYEEERASRLRRERAGDEAAASFDDEYHSDDTDLK